jgi:hypothetical protein
MLIFFHLQNKLWSNFTLRLMVADIKRKMLSSVKLLLPVLFNFLAYNGSERVNSAVQLPPVSLRIPLYPKHYRASNRALIMKFMVELKFLYQQLNIFTFYLYAYCEWPHTYLQAKSHAIIFSPCSATRPLLTVSSI